MRPMRFMVIAIVVALVATGLWLLANRGAHYRKKLQRLTPADVTQITLSVEPVTPGVAGRILKAEEKQEFLRLLAAGTSTSPNHPRGGWTCFVNLQTRTEQLVFRIQATSNNGTLVLLFSNGLDGWNLGTLRNDALEPFIARILFDQSAAGQGTNDPAGIGPPAK
jgi:hypothetical protein